MVVVCVDLVLLLHACWGHSVDDWITARIHVCDRVGDCQQGEEERNSKPQHDVEDHGIGGGVFQCSVQGQKLKRKCKNSIRFIDNSFFVYIFCKNSLYVDLMIKIDSFLSNEHHYTFFQINRIILRTKFFEFIIINVVFCNPNQEVRISQVYWFPFYLGCCIN